MSASPSSQSADQQAGAAVDDDLRIRREPGPEHQQLAAAIGIWDVAVATWTKDGDPPSLATGRAVISPVFAGRFIREEFTCEADGKSFAGVATSGYDRMANQFVTTWYDNASTGITRLTGQPSGQGGREITYRGAMMCEPELTLQVHHILTWETADRFRVAMLNNRAGEERKVMELIYTRRA